MNMDLELAGWRTDWLAPQPSDSAIHRPDLRRLVERKGRRMALAFIGQLLYGVALLVFSAWFASAHPTLEWALWAAVIWAATFSAVGFAIWNQAGTWKALSESNAAFLDLSRLRCRRELRAVRLGKWFLALQLAIVTVWLSWDFATHRLPMRPFLFGIGVTILVAAATLKWFAIRTRRSLRDLSRLDHFEDQPEI
jgi:hypothetical protein